MGFSVLEIEIIESKKEWQDVLNQVGYYDFYHTYDYHRLSKSPQEKPLLIVYREDDIIIGLPVLKRQIFNTNYSDLTSAYGYVGPIHKNVDSSFDNNNFIKSLKKYFIKHNIISVFSRLNPFIKNQEVILRGLGDVVQLNKIVNIDLTKDLQNQREIFSKTTKRYINKGRKECSVKIGGSKEDIKMFVQLYYENMDRVGAKKSYYFKEDYFHDLIDSKDFDTDVLFAVLNGTEEIISAAMMVKTKDIIQYHISGTKSDFMNLTPIRLLIDEMRIKGTLENYRYFNLGGGLGSKEDTLFEFKSSFSKDFKDFNIWKCIINEEMYKQLSDQFADKNGDGDFFPKYRNNII